MNLTKTDKTYVSDLDKFITKFDEENKTRSKSQMAEIEKHQKIAEKRDNPDADNGSDNLWGGF